MTNPAELLSLRKTVYTLLIVVAAAIAAGRIFGVARLPMATFADNDQSRWATVRALVDHGTYAIGERASVNDRGGFTDAGIITEDGWQTIDKVLDPTTNKFYSSKPPFLACLAAAEYRLLKGLFGWSITRDRTQVVTTILMTFNWLPLVFSLILLAQIVERHGATDWGRLYVLTAGCFATFLGPFMGTFNNHTIATCSALFALYPLLRIWNDGERRPGLFLAAGFFAAFTAANELPAAAFLLACFCLLFIRFPVRTLVLFVPSAILPIAGFLWTNYQAIGLWSPTYAQFGTPWYEYEGSFWAIHPGEAKHGIDWAYQTEGPLTYAFHILVGHHGWFSLSPIFLLAVAGAFWSFRPETSEPSALGPQEFTGKQAANLKMVAVLTFFLSVCVIGFYVFGVNPRNRNYGGWTTGLRWFMWLTPFWLLSMVPAADRLAGTRWGRGLAYLLLGVSAFAANYGPLNPWRHPWLYDLLEAKGWISY